MAGSGTATLDFGAMPGSAMAQVAVTGQTGILTSSQVEAWISLETATADHSKDEHLIENFRVRAGTIIAGTGFNIYGEVQHPWRGSDDAGEAGNRIYGQWIINWVWA